MKILFAILASVGLLLAGCTADSLTGVEEEEFYDGMPGDLAGSPDELAGKWMPVGTVTPIWTTPDGSPEGIAFDRRGNMYVGVRTVGSDPLYSKIVRFGRHGRASDYATLPESAGAAFGVLGLATDWVGNVYAALDSGDPATQGVYRISRGGKKVERLAGSEQIATPNALTFDAHGNLYVSDSYTGTIWRYGRSRVFTAWLQHELLAAVPVPEAPFPIPGVNGIAFYPPNKIYAANTSQFTIVRVMIAPDGNPGPADVVTGGFELFSIDGIAMDVHENIFGVLAASNAEEAGAPPVPALIKVNPKTGAITVVSEKDHFDAPTSLAFGPNGRDRKSVFVVNSALFGPISNGPGPGVVKVRVGSSGLVGSSPARNLFRSFFRGR